MTIKTFLRASLFAATALAGGTVSALAQTAPAAAPPPGLWIDGIHLSAQIEGGLSFAPAEPKQNIGQLFTDHPNQFQLNQVLLTAAKMPDPKATGFDWGFRLQGLYGSDARYTHFLGEFDSALPNARNQIDVVEADALFHLPWLTEGGIDVKAGQYPTPIGYETIDPSTNPFYSHSYIFFYGLPFKHTGILATAHVSPMLDVYLGVDTGVNTTFGSRGENNSAIGFLGGVNLTLLGGNLTVMALTHIGPENASRALSPMGFNADGYYRYLNDIVITYKATPALTLTTELNWIRDDFGGYYSAHKPASANAFGLAQYASYTLTDTVTLNARAEVYRDDNNFFVTNYATNNGADLAQQGFGVPLLGALHPTTYGEVTLGLTYKPAGLPAPVTGLMIRPEMRYDQDFGNTKAFDNNKQDGAFTAAADFVLDF